MRRRAFNARMLIATATPVGLPLGLAACAAPATKSGTITGIDTHAHIFHRGLPFIPNRRYTPSYDAMLEQYLAVLRENQISNGVIIPISILGTNNSYTLEGIRKSDGRLRGIAVVDPEKDLDKLNSLAAGGIAGIRFNLIGKPVPDLKAGIWRPLMDACRSLNWQVEIYDDAARLSQTINQLLDLSVHVVVDHFGKPDAKMGVEDPGFKYLLGLGPSKNVWVKLSAPYRSSNAIAAAAAPLLLSSFGPERLMWGSDWPHTGFEGKVKYADLLAQLSQWVPDAQARKTVLVDTPMQLFGFTSG